MATQGNGLGGRLPLIDPKTPDAAQQALRRYLDEDVDPWAERGGFHAKDKEGHYIGPFNAFLYSPEMATAFLDFVQMEQQRSTLSARVRQVIILTVGAVWKSSYELYAHRATADKAGLPPEAIKSVSSGESPTALTPEELVAYRYVRQLCTQYAVDDELYRQAVSHFGNRGLVDLAFLTGNYLMTCAILNSFQVPTPVSE